MEPAVLGIVLVSAATGLVAAWLLARFVRVLLGWVLTGVLALVAAGFLLAGQAVQGLDGLVYVILALVFTAPAVLGAALGTALGGWMRMRAGQGLGARD
ncbi:MAG: hypothetical protein JJU15_01560 [Pararhodobacter sp.]|nr:hypothetical protein [Pararhodobacter sp.]